MRLRNDVAGELASPVIVVTLAAGEVQLALTPVERGPAASRNGWVLRVDGDVDRQAARLARHVRASARAARGSRRRARGACWRSARHRLMRCSRLTGRSARGVERRIARGHALHGRRGRRRGSRRRRGRRRRSCAPTGHSPSSTHSMAGIGGVVVLHRPRLAAHELVAGAALGAGDLAGEGRGERDDQESAQSRGGVAHSVDRDRWRTRSPRSRCRRSTGTRVSRSRWRRSRRR